MIRTHSRSSQLELHLFAEWTEGTYQASREGLKQALSAGKDLEAAQFFANATQAAGTSRDYVSLTLLRDYATFLKKHHADKVAAETEAEAKKRAAPIRRRS